MLNTIFKSLTLATCLILGLSQASHGQTAEELLPRTISSSESNLLHSESSEQLSQITRPRRTRTRTRTRRGQTRKVYFGLGAGVFLPGEVSLEGEEGALSDDASFDFSNGFAIDFSTGYKFSQYFSAELDISAAFGSLEANDTANERFINDSDLDYTAFGIYINPRVEIPLAGDKFKLYVAPGIGFTNVNSDDGETDRDFDGEADNIYSDNGFSYQLKGGAAYQVSDRVGIFGQARYNSYVLNELDDNLNGITFELGATF